MELDVNKDGNCVNVVVRGSIDTEGAPELTLRCADIAKDDSIRHASFDLSDVPSITSAGIGKLLTFFKHFDKKGGTMTIKGISDPLHQQFREIHLDLIIPIKK